MARRTKRRSYAPKRTSSRTGGYGKSRVRSTRKRSGGGSRSAGRGGQTIKLVIQHDVPSGSTPFNMTTPQKATSTKKARL